MRHDLNTNSEQQKPIKQTFFGSLRRDTHWKCLILTVLILGCLVAISWCRLSVTTRTVVNFYEMSVTQTSRASPCDDGYVYIPVAFVLMLYLVYLVECWHSHTRIELQYKVDVNAVYDKIESMKEALPIVWWKAICYHYVRRTRQVTRYRNGDAFTTTQVYYERVNSHTSSSAFNFSVCGSKDISKNLADLDAYPATKIKFSKGFSFATVEAENEFEDQRAQFFQDHEQRDDYMETREGLDLLNVSFKEYMIAFADPHNLPWYVSHMVFWISSCLLLSWPLRVLIEYKTAYVHYHVHKLFGCNYLDPYCTGTMSRVSTMGSSELEMNIRNNYSMVPSYSEALLMDCAGHNSSANGYIPLSGANLPHSGSSHNGYMPLPLQSPSTETHTLVTTQNGHIVLQNGNTVGHQTSNHTMQNDGEITGYQMFSGVIQNPHALTGYVLYENDTIHFQRNSSLLPMGVLPRVQDFNVAPAASSSRRGGRLVSRHKKKKRKPKQQLQQPEGHRERSNQSGLHRSDAAHAHSDSDTVSHSSSAPAQGMTRSHTLTLTPSHHANSHLEYVQQDDASPEIGSDCTLPDHTGSDAAIPIDIHIDDYGEDTTSLSISVSEDREHFERVEVHTSSTILTEEIDSLPEDSGSPPDYEEALTMQIATSILQPSTVNTLPTTQPARYNVRASEASSSSLQRPLTIKCMETSL